MIDKTNSTETNTNSWEETLKFLNNFIDFLILYYTSFFHFLLNESIPVQSFYSISMYPSEFVRCAFSLIVFSATSWFEPTRQFFRLLPFRTIALSHRTQFSMTTLKKGTKLLNAKYDETHRLWSKWNSKRTPLQWWRHSLEHYLKCVFSHWRCSLVRCNNFSTMFSP